MTTHSTALGMGKIDHMGNLFGTGQLCPSSWADMPITWVKLPITWVKFAHHTWANLPIKHGQMPNSVQLFNLVQQSTYKYNTVLFNIQQSRYMYTVQYYFSRQYHDDMIFCDSDTLIVIH